MTSKPATRPNPPDRADFKVFESIQTRWADNDVYDHVNNVEYYGFFDTAVNHALMRAQLLDFKEGNTIGLVVHSGCKYFSSIAFPDVIEVGLRVSHIGNSSVKFDLAIFKAGETTAAAEGFFVHVYVDRQTRRPKPVPVFWRAQFERWR